VSWGLGIACRKGYDTRAKGQGVISAVAASVVTLKEMASAKVVALAGKSKAGWQTQGEEVARVVGATGKQVGEAVEKEGVCPREAGAGAN